jgi:hypothetical protein
MKVTIEVEIPNKIVKAAKAAGISDANIEAAFADSVWLHTVEEFIPMYEEGIVEHIVDMSKDFQ